MQNSQPGCIMSDKDFIQYVIHQRKTNKKYSLIAKLNNKKSDEYIENSQELVNSYQENHPEEKVDDDDYLMRLKLYDRLQAYVDRIDSYGDEQSKFSHGFWFFSRSRGDNRRANYLLAKNLISKLSETDDELGDIFNMRNLSIFRKDLFTRKTNHGMNSTELNSIIGDATDYVLTQSFKNFQATL